MNGPITGMFFTSDPVDPSAPAIQRRSGTGKYNEYLVTYPDGKRTLSLRGVTLDRPDSLEAAAAFAMAHHAACEEVAKKGVWHFWCPAHHGIGWHGRAPSRAVARVFQGRIRVCAEEGAKKGRFADVDSLPEAEKWVKEFHAKETDRVRLHGLLPNPNDALRGKWVKVATGNWVLLGSPYSVQWKPGDEWADLLVWGILLAQDRTTTWGLSGLFHLGEAEEAAAARRHTGSHT